MNYTKILVDPRTCIVVTNEIITTQDLLARTPFPIAQRGVVEIDTRVDAFSDISNLVFLKNDIVGRLTFRSLFPFPGYRLHELCRHSKKFVGV